MITRDSLVAEYLFNGNADDASGNGFHGVVHSATPAPDRFGNPNSAYAFDGKDDYIVVSPPPNKSSTLTAPSTTSGFTTERSPKRRSNRSCNSSPSDHASTRR